MWRTRVDIPQFTRCCFCIPLRFGIITSAYIKVGALVLAAISDTFDAIYSYQNDLGFFKAFAILMCIFIYLDLISTIFCIVVGHLKHRRGLTLYFYVSLSILIAFVTVSISFTIASLIKYSQYIRYQWIMALEEIFIIFISVFVQVYILLLVRSEILKLHVPPNLRFVNHDAEQARKGEAILEEREDTESRNGDDAFAYTY